MWTSSLNVSFFLLHSDAEFPFNEERVIPDGVNRDSAIIGGKKKKKNRRRSVKAVFKNIASEFYMNLYLFFWLVLCWKVVYGVSGPKLSCQNNNCRLHGVSLSLSTPSCSNMLSYYFFFFFKKHKKGYRQCYHCYVIVGKWCFIDWSAICQ